MMPMSSAFLALHAGLPHRSSYLEVGHQGPVGIVLLRRISVRNGSATGQCFVAEGRLPVPGDDQLRAIQELGSSKKGSGEVRAVENCFEQIRPLKVGAGEIRLAQARSSEIGTPKIRTGKIVPAQIEPAQTGLRQVWSLVSFRPP
jgi:hypothetical protein